MSFFANAQSDTDKKLAIQYFNQGAYQSAIPLLEDLYKFNPNEFYPYLVESYLAVQEFKDANKLIKKQLRKNDGDINLLMDAGKVAEAAGDLKQANEFYEQVIENLPLNPQAIIQIGDRFKDEQKYEWSIKTYQTGRKVLNGSYPFAFELGAVYLLKGDFPLVVEEYLSVIEINEGFLYQVQSALQTILNDDPSGKKKDFIRKELLKRVQSNNASSAYSELLIWLFIQDKKFNLAFLQSKALDKRLKENGNRVYSLGKIAMDNQDYEAAAECYEYLIDKGRSNAFYIQARTNYLKALKLQMFEDFQYTEEELSKIEKGYEKALADLGNNHQTVQMKRDYAEFIGFYLNKVDDAIALMEEAIQVPRTPREEVAACKMTLGDLLVFKGQVWEAVLYFGQVESDFKHDVIGHDAKFRKAKVYYYAGDFEWARSQLDVLKASTSKLIANDAMRLSLLITDNTGLDTNTVPVKMFARADLLHFQKQFQASNDLLDSILGHIDIQDDILFLNYMNFNAMGQYDKAFESLNKLEGLNTALSDEAIFYKGYLLEMHLDNREAAQEAYKKLMVDYPGSIYTVLARKRFRFLRGDISDTDDLRLLINSKGYDSL